MRDKRKKRNPKIPSRLRGRGVDVSKTLFLRMAVKKEKSKKNLASPVFGTVNVVI